LSAEEVRIKQMIEDIIENANVEAEKILKDVKKQTKEILQRGKEAAEAEKTQIIDAQAKMISEVEKQQIASINLQARKEILQKKEDEIQKAFGTAKEELKNFTKKATYAKVLDNLVIEAGIALNGGDLIVNTRKEDKTMLKDLTTLAKEITKQCGTKCTIKLGKDNIESIGGVIVQKEDETIKIDNTFESRLEQKYDIIRTKVAKVLFSDN